MATPLDLPGPVLVSACLLGARCRYDGGDRRDPRVLAAVAGREVVPVCPEEAGGLGTPRPPCDLAGGDGAAVLDGRARVVTRSGDDATAAFVRGAGIAAEAALRAGARLAILKEGSPSCGREGVCAARLARLGLRVLHEGDLA
ncbi:DUF523 domain-containing protein [Anaeromyxobacter paludicola]|uniref:DUF523 domain-containing protein n=1 Tax=Anaeromyxobacter paludicola TaxID=2918171 RepID=A0ABM7X8D7_9BACT|nr:DUF523 domain-containing protein [Anaeromyxobacter paludicola]BDG08103.1 hypothetical protein AMPC_12160 [Anaeromyxobacter paludicola]